MQWLGAGRLPDFEPPRVAWSSRLTPIASWPQGRCQRAFPQRPAGLPVPVCRSLSQLGFGHMLFERPALDLANLTEEFSMLVTDCSVVMARLVMARKQSMVSIYSMP